MPVGYKTKNVLYLQRKICSQYNIRAKVRFINTTQISYLSHKSHDGENEKASLSPKKE